MPGPCQQDHFVFSPLSLCCLRCLDLCRVRSEAGGAEETRKGHPSSGTCKNQGSGLGPLGSGSKGNGWVWKDGSCKVPLRDPSLTTGGPFLWVLQPQLGTVTPGH